MASPASIKRRLDRLEQLVARLRCVPASLDVVDLLTRMELSTGRGDEDVGEVWHRVRERLGVEDDGSGEGRICRLRERTSPSAPSSS